MNLGENIRDLRVQKNYSQGDLANELEVSRQSVSKWENNSAQPELDKLVKMSRLFDVTLDELVFGEEKVQPPQNTDLPHPLRTHVPTRVIAGTVMMLFGLIFFLLSIFWGDHLRFNEELAEFFSASVVLLSISLLATYSKGVLAICGVTYMLYSVLCIGILRTSNLINYLFMAVVSVILLVWFIIWGMKSEAQAKRT